MIVKFIVIEERIIFGEDGADWHERIAYQSGVLTSPIYSNLTDVEKRAERKKIKGGGYANLITKEIWGKSVDFGQYDKAEVERLLPEWKVKESE